MNRHKHEWISGLLDGQIKWPRRWFIARHLRVCPLCAAEYRRERHVRQMLQAHLPTSSMTDTPEFFWSKVKKEINRRGNETISAPLPTLIPRDWLGEHVMVLASGAAALAIAIGVAWTSFSSRPHSMTQSGHAIVERVTTAIPNTVATVLEPSGTDVTVIWVSGLPWTPDMTQMKTEFANMDI